MLFLYCQSSIDITMNTLPINSNIICSNSDFSQNTSTKETLLRYGKALEDDTDMHRDDEKLGEDVMPIFLGGTQGVEGCI